MIKVVDMDCAIRAQAPGAPEAAGRPSAIVRARGESGAVGLGEATPLPGRSPDTVDDCARALAALRGVLPISLSPKTALAFAADLATAVAGTAPAARFAIETALCDLVARTAGWPLARLLTSANAGANAGAPAASVAINALVATPAEAAAAIARGVACVKMKAHGDFDLDLARVQAIRAAIGGARLRVDANQSWPAGEVAARIAALAELGVEYVEEPARDFAPTVRAPLAAPLALDESLAADTVAARDAWLDDALASGAFAAVVLKPALLGGLTACLALAERARAHGVDAVVTHTFDGAIATAAACELARAIDGAADPDRTRAHGLDRPDLAAGVVPQLAPGVARDSGRAGLGIAAGPPRARALEVSP